MYGPGIVFFALLRDYAICMRETCIYTVIDTWKFLRFSRIVLFYVTHTSSLRQTRWLRSPVSYIANAYANEKNEESSNPIYTKKESLIIIWDLKHCVALSQQRNLARNTNQVKGLSSISREKSAMLEMIYLQLRVYYTSKRFPHFSTDFRIICIYIYTHTAYSRWERREDRYILREEAKILAGKCFKRISLKNTKEGERENTREKAEAATW